MSRNTTKSEARFLGSRLLAGVAGAAAVATLVVTSGCGRGSQVQIVKDVQLRTFSENGDAYGEVKALLDTGAVALPAFEFPINDPRNPNVTYGRLSLVPSLAGGSELGIAVNITDVAQLPSGDGRLPNGGMIPVGSLPSVIEIPIANTGAEVYMAIDRTVAMMGTAIPIREFDGIGGYTSGASMFTGFTFPNGVRGIAGVFTSREPGKSGIAFFVDASALLPANQPVGMSVLALSSGESGPVASGPVTVRGVSSRLSFADVKPSRRHEDQIRSALFQMHMNRTRLHMR